MLVLTRKKDESILIGEDIALMVRDIRADGVRLDVTCPENTSLRTSGSDAHTGPSPAHVDLATDQALLIGSDIQVTIEGLHFLAGQPKRIRLGIQAPREIPILREEIRPK